MCSATLPCVSAVPEPPPRLPTVEGDLGAWVTYAAELRAAGDQRGALMELDLSLPAWVEREQVMAYHRACRRLCRPRPATPASWSVAHARELGLWPIGGYPWASVPRSPEHGAFANAHDFLRSPVGSRVERFNTIWPARDDERPWRRLMRAMPATCATIGLLHFRGSMPIDQLLASLPDTVRNATILRGGARQMGAWAALIDDRFDIVDLDTMSMSDTDVVLLSEILGRTSRVRLRVNRTAGPLCGAERVLAGTTIDARLSLRDGKVLVLGRWSLSEHEAQLGHIPIRAQLAASLPEGHGVGLHQNRLSAFTNGRTLIRRGTLWTLRALRDHETAHNGRVIDIGEFVPVRDGDRLRFGAVECVFAPGADSADPAAAT